MKISFDDVGTVRVDNVKFCYWELGNDREDIPAGSYPVEARFAHAYGKILPHVDGVGWIGSDTGAAIIFGKVRNRANVLPDNCLVQRLVACIEAAADSGQMVTAEMA